MTGRTLEPHYWESQQLAQSQYPSHLHYYASSAPAMANQQQQQPRQAPLFNALAVTSETSSGYAPSNVYYGSFHQSTQMNGGSGTGSYGALMTGAGHSAHPGNNSGGGMSTSYAGMAPSSVNVVVHYPMGEHASSGTHHFNGNNGLYHRSHVGDMSGSMMPGVNEMAHHQHQQQQQQQHQPGSSQHSGSPTIDGSEYGQSTKPKRRQVKNACINCQKACKRCDEGRPCSRCVKYGLTDTCQDSSRKERKRGIKRGPYKRRAATNAQATTSATSHYSQSPNFVVMDGLQNGATFHAASHASMSPHLRNHREEQGGMGD